MLDGREQKKVLKLNGEARKPTPANLKYAERLALEIKERIRHGTFSMSEYFPEDGNTGHRQLTVGGQLDTWLAAQRIEGSTRKTYTSSINFWKHAPVNANFDAMGDLPLRTLRHSHVLTALASRPNLAGKTVNNHVSILREACQLAVIDRVLTINPVQEVKKAAYQKPPPDPFSAAEAELIIEAIGKRYDPQERNYVEFKFFTGLRPSEAIALRWENVDLVRKEMLICEAVVLGTRKDTKTNVARVVKLNTRAMSVLERQRQHTFAYEAVFHNPLHNAAWADEKWFKKRCWMSTLKRLGMRYRPPYNTRHTYATTLLMADVKLAFAAKQMGHSVKVFAEIYARWLDGDRDDLEMDRLERFLPNSSHEGDRKAKSPVKSGS